VLRHCQVGHCGILPLCLEPDGGALPKLNGALLILILRKEVAEQPEDFRPISLIHSLTKLISNVLVICLSPHINGLVSNAQSAFICQWGIQDNPLYLYKDDTLRVIETYSLHMQSVHVIP
jgi:hypothetical protein